jgi:hypothetical protein
MVTTNFNYKLWLNLLKFADINVALLFFEQWGNKEREIFVLILGEMLYC